MKRAELEGWRSAHRRSADGAIESDECVTATRPVVAPTNEGARALGERYWREVTRASFGLVRLRGTPGGSDLRFRGVGVRLLRFGPTEVEAGDKRVVCRFPIRGGLLARRPGGALVLSQGNGEMWKLRAAVTGFVPRLGSRPYDRIQRRIHVAISRRFFRSLLEEPIG
jgi:hypothetical protein